MREVYILSTLGENLRFYREKAGFSTAKEFAAAIGMNYASYVAYENRDRQPAANTLLKIADALNVSINALLGFPEVERYEEFKRLVVDAGYPLEEKGEKIYVIVPGHKLKATFFSKKEFCYWVGKGVERFDALLSPVKSEFIRQALDEFMRQ